MSHSPEEKRSSGDATEVVKTVTYRVRRYIPEQDQHPRWQDFAVPVRRGMTVLDGLGYIKENLDSSLAWRSSCRMGVCGSCAMFINGLPRLACETQIVHLKSDVIAVAPLPNIDNVRDLVPNLGRLFEKHKRTKPWLIRSDKQELENPTAEYAQSPEELTSFLQFAYCMKCACCMAACPTLATDPSFMGPQPLAQAYRFTADPRDGGFAERRDTVANADGVWKCHFAGACSEVCPKGVDPAFGNQLLRRELVFRYFGLKKDKPTAPVLSPPEGVDRNPDIPEAPEPTVT